MIIELRVRPSPVEVTVEERSCSKCGAKGEKLILSKCPICYKLVCEACQAIRGGRVFCGPYCADYFFSEEE